MISQSFDLQYKKRGVFMIFTREKPNNKKPSPLDFRVGDNIQVIAGDFAGKIGKVEGHYDANLIVTLDYVTVAIPYTNVIKWLG